MDLTKHKEAFNKMNYDESSGQKETGLKITASTIIVTESSDLDGVCEFIAFTLQSEDFNQIRTILVQSSVETKFLALIESKLKPLKFLDARTADKVKKQLADFASKGFTVINSAIVRCPRNLMPLDEEVPIVNLEIFRTTKEAVTFAKEASSVGLWSENVSIAFEYINSLPKARQIWLNASHGLTHPKIPFFSNGQIVCDPEVKAQAVANIPGSTVQVANHVQFISTFRANNSFQTVVIPYGESFAN